MSVEYRAFAPCSLASLPASVVELLSLHLGLSSLSKLPKLRKDLYALTGFSRLGLKQRNVSSGTAEDAPWELKLSSGVSADGSELLTKYELSCLPQPAVPCPLPLAEAEQQALARLSGASALVGKLRWNGTLCSELVDLTVTCAGRTQPCVSFCFEEGGWGGTGSQLPQQRGQALLQALQLAHPSLPWRVCSFAGWLEETCAPGLPDAAQAAAEAAAAAPAAPAGLSAYEAACQGAVLVPLMPSQFTAPAKHIAGLQCSYFALLAASQAGALLRSARAARAHPAALPAFSALYTSALLQASAAKARSASRGFIETVYCPTVLLRAGATVQHPPPTLYAGPAPFAALPFPTAAAGAAGGLQSGSGRVLLGQFKAVVLNPAASPDAMDAFYTGDSLSDQDYRQNARVKMALPRASWEELLGELAALHTASSSSSSSSSGSSAEAAVPVCILHRCGEAFALISDSAGLFLVCDSHASQVGWMTTQGVAQYLRKGGAGEGYTVITYATGTALAVASPAAALYLRCPYCSVLFPLTDSDSGRHDSSPLLCQAPLPAACFACGTPAVEGAAFSATQRARVAEGEPGYCQACIAAGMRGRCEPPLLPQLPGEALHSAVQAGDAALVRELLARGVDANSTRQAGTAVRGRWQPLFLADGSPAPEADPEDEQPTTPLKLAGFRVSDCTLGAAELAAFESIARELVRHGADARPALRHMQRRYGAFDSSAAGSVQGVYAIVHAAAASQPIEK